MNQPSKFTIKKPRITLTEEQKNQARAGMAGEAVKAAGEPAPPVEPEPTPVPAAAVAPPAPTEVVPEEEFLPIPPRQGRGNRSRKPEKKPAPVTEDSETQHVRMSKDVVKAAKMNVLLLPESVGIRSLRDYGDAAFAFFEAHLRKTGKLPIR